MAADGIDEFLALFLESDIEPGERKPEFGGTISVEATDTGDAWAVTISESGMRGASGAPGTPDATIAGTSEELLLALWRRQPLDPRSLTGDRILGAAFIAWTDLA